MLATHEAAANAMEHGQPESPVTVTASQCDDGGFIVEVTDAPDERLDGPFSIAPLPLHR